MYVYCIVKLFQLSTYRKYTLVLFFFFAGWVQASIDANMKEIPLGIMPSASAISTADMEALSSSNSPRGVRKLGSTLKSGPKRLQTCNHTTPPESPTLPLRKFK